MIDQKRLDVGTKQSLDILSNGVKLIVVQKRNAPVHLKLTVLGGDALYPEQERGLAHFAEHMILAGTGKYPSKDKIALFLDQFGGNAGGATNLERMYVHINVAAGEYVEHVFHVLRELLGNSTFAPKVMETERGAIVSEYRGKYAKTGEKTARAFMESVFKGTAYEFPTLGTLDSIQRISVADVQGYLKRHLRGGRIGIVISGDISRKDAVRWCEKTLSFIRQSPIERIDPKKKIITPEHFDPSLQVRYIEAQEDVSNVMIGFRMPHFSSAEYRREFSLIANIIGSGRGSLLNKLFRYETGLVYGISASASSFMAGPGLFEITANCRSENLLQVVSMLLNFIKKDYVSHLTEERFRLVKQKYVAALRTGYESANDWASFHSPTSVRTDDIKSLSGEIEALQAISYDRFCLAIAEMFSPRNIYLAYSGKENKDDEIRGLFNVSR